VTDSTPFGRHNRPIPTVPQGETVASFDSHAEAQAAVDILAKAEFPVTELSIIGTDLTSVERITGKLSWGRAAGAGALSGAWLGVFLGLIFVISSSATTYGILGATVLLGAGFGMIFGLVSYSVNRRRRDFTSIMQVLATRYEIITNHAHVGRARQVLGVSGAGPVVGSPASSTGVGSHASPPHPAVMDTPRERPRYGEYAPQPPHGETEGNGPEAVSDDRR